MIRRRTTAKARPGIIRRVLRALAAVAVVAAVAVSGGWLWRTLDVPVQVVRIEGDLDEAERARAKRVVGGFLPAGVLSLDMAALRGTLEAESWVEQVSLRRVWPQELRVRVLPEEPVALWRDGQLLSSRGEIIAPLAPPEVATPGLPRLSGPLDSAALVMEAYQRITEMLRPFELQVSAVERDASGSVSFETAAGVEIVLGREDLPGRLQRLSVVLGRALGERLARVTRIDTRYDNGVAVAWRDQPRIGSQLAQRTPWQAPPTP